MSQFNRQMAERMSVEECNEKTEIPNSSFLEARIEEIELKGN